MGISIAICEKDAPSASCAELKKNPSMMQNHCSKTMKHLSKETESMRKQTRYTWTKSRRQMISNFLNPNPPRITQDGLFSINSNPMN